MGVFCYWFPDSQLSLNNFDTTSIAFSDLKDSPTHNLTYF